MWKKISIDIHITVFTKRCNWKRTMALLFRQARCLILMTTCTQNPQAESSLQYFIKASTCASYNTTNNLTPKSPLQITTLITPVVLQLSSVSSPLIWRVTRALWALSYYYQCISCPHRHNSVQEEHLATRFKQSWDFSREGKKLNLHSKYFLHRSFMIALYV